MAPSVYALGAIALWATLASLGLALQHIPPFLLTGIALLVGGVPAWPLYRQWRIPASTLLLGVCGLFGYHFLLFIALRHAPAVEANLVNYLWPLLIVVLAPVLLPGKRLTAVHLLAAGMGFAGAAIAIVGGREVSAQFAWGYLPALGAAVTWACYSLLTQRVAHFPTAAIGLFGLVSGALSLLCHFAMESRVDLSSQDWLLLAVMGLGPLGAAFFLWDKALKGGNAQHIGILSYLTPLCSTVLLMQVSHRPMSWNIAAAAALIIAAAILGTRAR